MREPTKPTGPAPAGAPPVPDPGGQAAAEPQAEAAPPAGTPPAGDPAAATVTPGASTAAGTPAGGVDPIPATATDPNAERIRIRAETLVAFRRALAVAGGLGAGGLRLLMPLLGAYAGGRIAQAGEAGTGGDVPKSGAGLNPRETAVLAAAAGKALTELLEITSRSDPIGKDATPYVAFSDGMFRPPHLMHLLALAIAARRVLGDGDGQASPPPPAIDAGRSVAFVALAPGEYARELGPLTPTAIRRSAMRERTYNAPQLAMLAREANGFRTAPAAGTALPTAAGGSAARGHGEAGGGHGGCGCSACGGASKGACGCGSCGGAAPRYPFSPARRDANGKCVPVANVSCETGWRVRECLKFTLCDFIRCVGEQVCEDGQFAPQPDLGACLEGLVCSLLTCLPEAICPPPPPAICCPPALPDDCNYACGR